MNKSQNLFKPTLTHPKHCISTSLQPLRATYSLLAYQTSISFPLSDNNTGGTSSISKGTSAPLWIISALWEEGPVAAHDARASSTFSLLRFTLLITVAPATYSTFATLLERCWGEGVIFGVKSLKLLHNKKHQNKEI